MTWLKHIFVWRMQMEYALTVISLKTCCQSSRRIPSCWLFHPCSDPLFPRSPEKQAVLTVWNERRRKILALHTSLHRAAARWHHISAEITKSFLRYRVKQWYFAGARVNVVLLTYLLTWTFWNWREIRSDSQVWVWMEILFNSVQP